MELGLIMLSFNYYFFSDFFLFSFSFQNISFHSDKQPQVIFKGTEKIFYSRFDITILYDLQHHGKQKTCSRLEVGTQCQLNDSTKYSPKQYEFGYDLSSKPTSKKGCQ